mmetsp:Transcript_46731/g.91241  ORF Transcript_46731/g.91241 Transcript_46731/m.91241 type:complete len:214 (-) Transcript_46731:5844-6485(-)
MERERHPEPVRPEDGRAARRGLRARKRDLDRGGDGGLGEDRVSRHDQGFRGGRRQGDPSRGQGGGRGRRLPPGGRGGARIAHLHHAAVAEIAPPRGAAHRRRVRRGHRARRTGLLRAAPSPEDRGGRSTRRGRSHGVERDGGRRRAAGQGCGVRQRRHGRIPLLRARQKILLSRAQPAAAGRASRHGDDHQGQPPGDTAAGGHGPALTQHSRN